jgi:hypothetical protein
MEMGRSWQELGVVDTIYEDDHEEEEEDDDEGETEDCFNSPTISSSAPTSASCSPSAAAAHSASLPPVLRTAAREWYVPYRKVSVQFSSVRRGLRRTGGIQRLLTEDRFAFRVQVAGERIAQAGRDRACPGALLPSAQGKIDRSDPLSNHRLRYKIHRPR